MVYEVTCECGWTASGAKDELVTRIQEHGRAVHNMDVTPDQALAQIKPAQA